MVIRISAASCSLSGRFFRRSSNDLMIEHPHDIMNLQKFDCRQVCHALYSVGCIIDRLTVCSSPSRQKEFLPDRFARYIAASACATSSSVLLQPDNKI